VVDRRVRPQVAYTDAEGVKISSALAHENGNARLIVSEVLSKQLVWGLRGGTDRTQSEEQPRADGSEHGCRL
jgi:hypothetical protein